MGWIEEIFERTDLYHIQNYLVYESVSPGPEGSYDERIKQAKEPMETFLAELFPNEMERDDTIGPIHTTLCDLEDIYMEIGMKVGAKIQRDLMLEESIKKEKKATPEKTLHEEVRELFSELTPDFREALLKFARELERVENEMRQAKNK